MENCHHTSTIFISISGKVQVNIWKSNKLQTIAFQPKYDFGHMGTNYKREKMVQNFNSIWAMQVVTKRSKIACVMQG